MAWCFSTRASVAMVLTMHPCVSRCLRVKGPMSKSNQPLPNTTAKVSKLASLPGGQVQLDKQKVSKEIKYRNEYNFVASTQGDQVMPYGVKALCHQWFRHWLVFCSAPSHFLTNAFNWSTRHKTSLIFAYEIHNDFHCRKCICKCCLQNGSHFFWPRCLTHSCAGSSIFS